MKSKSFQALTSELTQLTPHQRNILSDRLREVEHTSASRTLIEESYRTSYYAPDVAKNIFILITIDAQPMLGHL